MPANDEYFRDRFPADKQTVDTIDKLLGEVRSIFELYRLPLKNGKVLNAWPYEIVNDQEVDQHLGKLPEEGYHFNTNAMMLFVLAVISGRMQKSSLIASGEYRELLSADDKSIDFFDDNLHEIVNKIHDLKGKSASGEKMITTSVVFGANYPFTLTWLYDILKNQRDSDKKYGKLKADIIQVVYSRLNRSFLNHELEKVLELNEGSTLLDHIYPLVRMLHFYITSKKEARRLQEETKDQDALEIPHAYMSSIREYLLSRVYRHFTFQQLGNSSFDVAEMVFGMEGVLLLDKELNRTTDNQLVDSFFEAVKKCQENTPYWRPVKPIISHDNGMLLLPQSVNIASALVRICDLLEKENIYYFTVHNEIFRKYTEWLLTRTTSVKVISEDGKTRKFTGWFSENTNDSRKIHPLETVRVILFLIQYRTMYQQHIAREALTSANLKAIKPKRDGKKDKGPSDYWKEVMEVKEPFASEGKNDLNEYQVFGQIRKRYIEPVEQENHSFCNYSMLIYGPPGTGKSSLSQELANALGWPLITITPSDFISQGASQVEARAKSIFETLGEQHKVVIFFDEIDRMILDRDSTLYQEQGDMFQFMTPSMLVKLKDLRSAKNCIFLIATNYEERIDNAAKRVGRIDQKYLVLPPNKARRQMVLHQFLCKFVKKYKLDIDAEKVEIGEEIANLTVFAIKGELRQLVEEMVREVSADNVKGNKANAEFINKKLVSVWDEKMPDTQIKLETYRSRFFERSGKRRLGQLPFTEFLLLTYLKYETLVTGKKLNVDAVTPLERDLVLQIMNLLATNEETGDDKPDIEKVKKMLKKHIHDESVYQPLIRLYEELEKKR